MSGTMHDTSMAVAEALLLAPVAELNEQLLRSVRAQARASRADSPPLVLLLQAQWSELEDSALTRLAACPYLLVDAGLARAERWERPPTLAVSDAARGGCFVGDGGVALVRQALLFAWHLARSNRAAAHMLVGMSAACASRLASWRLQDLESLAELRPNWIAPRWQAQPLIWQQLMHAARRNEPMRLRQLQLRGLQLLAAALPGNAGG